MWFLFRQLACNTCIHVENPWYTGFMHGLDLMKVNAVQCEEVENHLVACNYYGLPFSVRIYNSSMIRQLKEKHGALLD